MKITVLTMFPELFDSFVHSPLPSRAVKNGSLDLRILDIRPFAGGSFRHLDDSAFGGGTGMILRAKPVLSALESVLTGNSRVAALTPAGPVYNQETARRLSMEADLILICGHYEGMDERILEHVDERISIGNYILSGGEIAAQAVMDSVIRLLPGVLKEGVTEEESFETGLLEYPQYTQPADLEGERVPDVLLSGDHEKIRKWRLKESLRMTQTWRPDLLEKRTLSPEEKDLLLEIRKEQKKKANG